MGLLQNKYKLVSTTSIFIDRDNRQRREIDTTDLDESICERGVYVPIIVEEKNGRLELIAGERRLTSCLKQGILTIPVRFAGELSETERQIIELEENVKRKDLHWRDDVRAVGRIHYLYCEQKPDWVQADTAKAIGLHPSLISAHLRVFADLDSAKIEECTSARQAYNVLARQDDRASENLLSDIMETTRELFKSDEIGPTTVAMGDSANVAQGIQTSASIASMSPPVPPKSFDSILNEDFSEWVKTYSGPKFNFIHCDFPYGVNVFGGTQANTSGSQQSYSDEPDVYWKLIETLCANLDTIMTPSAHLMFWFPMEYYSRTLKTFRELAPSLQFSRYPLYWTKTDNMGILPDPKRGPRRIVETALIASREDRLIAKAVSNWYGCQTDKKYHPSTKPLSMLEHFFTMFVDESTRMLDPTCGSGSSIRAAEASGAELVLGLERDKEHYESACSALRSFRTLRKASSMVKV